MRLYSFGSNGSYQLGLTHSEDISTPTACLFHPNPRDEAKNPTLDWPGISKVIGGGNHTLVQLSDGRVQAVGENTGFRCGALIPQTSIGKRKFLVEFKYCVRDVTLCAASWEATAVTYQNENFSSIWTTGIGARGELGTAPGIATSDNWMSVTTFHSNDPNVYPIDLAAGMNHFVAVLSNGEAYGWGKGRNGQLGEPREDNWEPRKIMVPFKAVRVVCGREFTYILGEFDSGNHIVLGSDKNHLISELPMTAPNWKEVGATWSSILVLDQVGKLHTWGKPTRTSPPEDVPVIEHIAVGSEHVLAKTGEGKVIAWGWGKHGNCGLPVDGELGDVVGRYNEIPIEGTVKLLGAGCATSWIGVE